MVTFVNKMTVYNLRSRGVSLLMRRTKVITVVSRAIWAVEEICNNVICQLDANDIYYYYPNADIALKILLSTGAREKCTAQTRSIWMLIITVFRRKCGVYKIYMINILFIVPECNIVSVHRGFFLFSYAGVYTGYPNKGHHYAVS
jgi:hypothetical protein